jgi:hypothetical protein
VASLHAPYYRIRFFYFQNNERLILPWLIVNMISIGTYGFLTLTLLVGLAAILLTAVIGNIELFFLVIRLFIENFRFSAFQIYLWICVYSLYRDIIVKRAMVANQNQAHVLAPYSPGWVQSA